MAHVLIKKNTFFTEFGTLESQHGHGETGHGFLLALPGLVMTNIAMENPHF